MGLHIRGGRAGSAQRVKSINEGKARTWIRFLKEGEDLTVRFLTEPDDWQWYWEHYSPEVNFFPCVGSHCPGCNSENEQTQRASRRFLANVLDISTGQVVPLKLPLDLANRLVARYERNGNTLTDRDYTLHRMGKRLETTYDVTSESGPQPMDLSRYELADLEQVLVGQFRDAFGMDDESPEQDSAQPRLPESSEPAWEVDEDDDDLDDDVPSEPSPSPGSDDDDEYLTEDEALKMSRDELKSLAAEYEVAIKSNWNKQRIVDEIFSSVAE